MASVCQLLQGIPFGALNASVLVLFSGVAFAVGMQRLGPPLDAFARDLGLDGGLGDDGLRYVSVVYVIILLVSLAVVWRGAVVEARRFGCVCFGAAGFPAECASVATTLWTVLVGFLLWACVILAIPVLCIAEAYYILFGVLFFKTCEDDAYGAAEKSTTLFKTLISVLEAVNQPPLSAGIDFSVTPSNEKKLLEDFCEQRDTLRQATTLFLAGGVALLVAAIILLAMWERYSKAWEFAADEHGGNANEETELMRPRTPRRCERRPTRAPHIVVLMLDDLGFADTGFGGSPVIRTPAIDELASRAVHLMAFRAPTWCAPSRATFLTGRHGWQLGILTSGRQPVLAAETALLPEVLRDLGYRTALVGKFHANVRSCRTTHRSGGPFGCGFDQQYGFVGGMSDYWMHHASWSRDGALGKRMTVAQYVH